jgi:hypothetical protein
MSAAGSTHTYWSEGPLERRKVPAASGAARSAEIVESGLLEGVSYGNARHAGADDHDREARPRGFAAAVGWL